MFAYISFSLSINDVDINSPFISDPKHYEKSYMLQDYSKELSFCNHSYIPPSTYNNSIMFTYSTFCSCEQKVYNAELRKFSALIIIADITPGRYSYFCNINTTMDVYEVSDRDVHDLVLVNNILYNNNTVNQYTELFFSIPYKIICYVLSLTSTAQILISLYKYFVKPRGGAINYYSHYIKFRRIYNFISFITISCLFTLFFMISFDIKIFLLIDVLEMSIVSMTILSTMLLILSWLKCILETDPDYTIDKILKICAVATFMYTLIIIMQFFNLLLYVTYYTHIPYIDEILCTVVMMMSVIISIYYVYVIHKSELSIKNAVMISVLYILNGSVYLLRYMFLNNAILYIVFTTLLYTINMIINQLNIQFANASSFGVIYDYTF